MHRAAAAVLLFLLLLIPLALVSQAPPSSASLSTTSDPRAVALASAARLALTGGSAVSDVTLSGNVTWFAGSQNVSGKGTLMASGSNQSRVDLTATGFQRTEIRNNTTDQAGAWSSGSTLNSMSWHNCWGDASWFFPALFGSLSPDPSVVFTFVRQETRNGLVVNHIRAYHWLSGTGTGTANLVAQLSTVDLYLDPTTNLPLIVAFNLHPDNDPGTNIPTEVRFGGYQAVNGIVVPFRIQRLTNGSLNLDFQVTGVSLNTGVPSSKFDLPSGGEQ